MGTASFSSFAYAARAEFERRGLELPLGRVQELLAAMLGYASKAAMERSSEEAPGGFEVAASVVADHEQLEKRLRTFEVRDDVTPRRFVLVLIMLMERAQSESLFELINPEDFRDSDYFRSANNSIWDAMATLPQMNAILARHSLSACEDYRWNAEFDTDEIQATTGRWIVPFAGSARITSGDTTCIGKSLRYEGRAWVEKPGRRCLAAAWNIEDFDIRISDTPIEVDW